MIHSMTAYARREIKGEWGTGTWEVRSVNQRYLETFIRHQLNPHEIKKYSENMLEDINLTNKSPIRI